MGPVRAECELLLSRARPMADGIAALLFPVAEVVVHDLASQTVVHLANNLSRRELGDASALEDLAIDAQHSVIGPYEKQNWDGGRMRSVSVVIRDDVGVPLGVVCINLSIAVFEQARAALDLFVTGVRVMPQPDLLFRDDWQERINTFLHGWLHDHQLSLPSLTREQKRALVIALDRDGAFRGRSAATYVAKVLSMGRATVFKHLKSARDSACASV